MAWTLVESAMKGLTFAGVLAAALMLALPARRAVQRRLAFVLGVGGVILMVLNATLGASLAGLLVDGAYLSLTLALGAWRLRAPGGTPALEEPLGGEQGA